MAAHANEAAVHSIGDLPTMPPEVGNATNKQTRNDSGVQIGSLFADRYLIQDTLGAGGMGVVYLAVDQLSEKTVALKVIRTERAGAQSELRRLKQEGLTARDIRHKHVVAVYDIGECDGQPFMSMEYLPGRSLRSWLRTLQHNGNEVPFELARHIVAQVLAGLQAAHEAGVIHRDLKPENIMVTNEDPQQFTVKILDFGIARVANSGISSNNPMGSIGYMPPEQKTNPDSAGPSADLYSVSVLLYELLAGVIPQGHWQPPSGGRVDVPSHIDALVERGLANRPANRVQSTDEYLHGLYQDSAPNHLQSTAPATNFFDWYGQQWSNFWQDLMAKFDPSKRAEAKAQAKKVHWSVWVVIAIIGLSLAAQFDSGGANEIEPNAENTQQQMESGFPAPVNWQSPHDNFQDWGK